MLNATRMLPVLIVIAVIITPVIAGASESMSMVQVGMVKFNRKEIS